MIILGIDPGSISGAYAVLHTDEGVIQDAHDLPVVDRNISPKGFAALVGLFQPDVAIVERVSAMPKQGVSSTFAFGRSVGVIHGVLGAMEIPLEMVTPQVWKKHFKLTADKEKSRELAMRLYPGACRFMTHKKHAGRAEAILLARWLQDHRN